MKEIFHKAVVQSRERKIVGPSLITCMDLPDLKKPVVLLTDMKRFDSYVEDSQYWVEDMID